MAELTHDARQLEAIAACSNTSDVVKRIVAVTGAAGTGKTTIMRVAAQALRDKGYKVVLAAPTGKAAKRIEEATGLQAMTIHRLLEFPHPHELDKKTGKYLDATRPKRCRTYPLEYDYVFVDEYAMVSNDLHNDLLAAVPHGGRLRVFGDINQLPPIERVNDGSPSPFKRLLTKFVAIELNTIHRQGEGSGIIENGARILRGFIPQVRQDFILRVTDKPVDSLVRLIEMYERNGVNLFNMQNQIITTANQSWIGTLKLNVALQRLADLDRDQFIDVQRHEWDKTPLRLYVDDKVIYSVNCYDLELFNGETGIVTAITNHGEIEVDFGDRHVLIPPRIMTKDAGGRTVVYNPQRSISLAYAITTHKAQGSEYQNVVYVLNKSTRYNQNRHNFYTAVTRARKATVVVTDQTSLSYSVWRQEVFRPRKTQVDPQ